MTTAVVIAGAIALAAVMAVDFFTDFHRMTVRTRNLIGWAALIACVPVIAAGIATDNKTLLGFALVVDATAIAWQANTALIIRRNRKQATS